MAISRQSNCCQIFSRMSCISAACLSSYCVVPKSKKIKCRFQRQHVLESNKILNFEICIYLFVCFYINFFFIFCTHYFATLLVYLNIESRDYKRQVATYLLENPKFGTTAFKYTIKRQRLFNKDVTIRTFVINGHEDPILCHSSEIKVLRST